MSVESTVGYVDTTPFITYVDPGAAKMDAIIAQDAERDAVLAPFTLMAQVPSTGKYVPLTNVSVLPTVASMVCGACGLETAFDDVTAGSFKITVDGTEITMTGLNFTPITNLFDVAEIIDASALGRFRCRFNGTAMVFISPITGVNSSVSVLSAAGSGTDISGASFLNGLTGVGTVHAAEGPDGTEIPLAIYLGNEVSAEAIVAADVTDCIMLLGDAHFDESQLVLENSLTLDDVVLSTNMTIRAMMQGIGLFAEETIDITAYENA